VLNTVIYSWPFFYLNTIKHVNNVKLSIELSCTKLKERFLEKEERVNGS
jgi:hypothetical protein